MKIYLAGPMRGIPLFNFPAFHAAAKRLRDFGHEVLNPAEHDVNEGFHPETDEPLTMSHYMERDLPMVCQSEAVAVLPGWQKSEGANLEVLVARRLGKKVLDAETLQPIAEHNGGVEVRVTDPKTGGQKGSKLERFDLIPVEPLEELARVYGRGAQKYADDNWRKGYSWRLSFAAMMRHAWAFWRGEEIDRETGRKHLACAAWHCFTLMWFSQYRRELDDRPK